MANLLGFIFLNLPLAIICKLGCFLPTLRSSFNISFVQGVVDLKIVYDDDVYGARILAVTPTASNATDEDDGLVCNHIIAMQVTTIILLLSMSLLILFIQTSLGDQHLEWSAFDFSTDPPSQKTFKVEFEDQSVDSEFRDMFAEGNFILNNWFGSSSGPFHPLFLTFKKHYVHCSTWHF